jgi:hypothetical protein
VPTKPVPVGPYLVLVPTSGPPNTRTVYVRGAHLPPSTPVQLTWSTLLHLSGISTTAYTDKLGRLSSSFTIPASQPGRYRIVAQVGGNLYATALYTVRSEAVVTVSVSSAPGSVILTIQGARFLPREKLLLVAYSMTTRQPPIILGYAQTGRRGSFRLIRSTRQLVTGQYALRAFATGASSAQMAETFFEVVV